MPSSEVLLVAGQEAHDKAAELGVAKPTAEKLDLQKELQVRLLPREHW